jgi:acetate kinase
VSVLGAEVDSEKNEAVAGEPGIISTDASATDVLVVPTDEERRIARQTTALVE